MFENYTLADLKNAPLSILVFLSLSGNRTVTVTDLAAETGYSEKPIRTGLRKLRDLGLITEPRKNRYQLTGKEYQLPLSWGERILEAGDSPKIAGNYTVNAGVSPELEKRVLLLEKAVFGNLDTKAGDSPEMPDDFPLWESEKEDSIEIVDSPRDEWSGNIPGKLGVYPVDGRNTRTTAVTGQWVEKENKGKTPEITGETPRISGDNPESVNPLINININKASKYVSKEDTYLLNGMSKEVMEVNLGESGQQEAVGSVPGDKGHTADTAMIHWNAAMEQMKVLMDRSSYSTMLKDAVVLGYEDGHYTIGVKNLMVRDWVDQRCRAMIERILNGMSSNAGVVQSVSFVVSEEPEKQHGGQSPVQAACFEELDQQTADPVEEKELLPKSGNPVEDKLVEICNEYLEDPTGIVYSLDELSELIAMHADPRVLRYILPRAKRFESAKKICGRGFAENKRRLLAKSGIISEKFCHDDNVSLELISDVCQEVCDGTEEGKRTACWRIGKLAVGEFEL